MVCLDGTDGQATLNLAKPIGINCMRLSSSLLAADRASHVPWVLSEFSL